MKKMTLATIALSFGLASTALAGTTNLYTKQVLGFDSGMNPIYGAINGKVKTKNSTDFTYINGDFEYEKSDFLYNANAKKIS